MQYVIIGNGVAGVQAAEQIRRWDGDGKITMVADENCAPYCRPMISLLLEGSIQPEQLPIRGKDFYRRLDITPVLGKRVSGIDPISKTITIPDGGTIAFDKLLIATGADPRPIRAENQDLKNISYMRTEAQVRRIAESLPHVRHALVLGGGLVGFKASYGLLRRGLSVTMLIGAGYPLSMQADDVAGRMIQGILEQNGLTVRLGVEVRGFEGTDRVESARLSDGSAVDCDLVVIAKGVVPALSFVPQGQMDVGLGILVNEQMQTSRPDIYAAGDVAECIDIARESRRVNALWPEAVEQGRIAGMNMAGRQVAYRGSLSRNVMRIFDLDVMSGGVVNPEDTGKYEILSHIDKRNRRYRKLVFEGDILKGMVMLNQVEQGGALLALMGSRQAIRIPKQRMLEPGFNFRQLI